MYNDLKPLVIQAQAGDRRAFSSLIDRCKRAVYGVCLSLMGEFDLAEDMAQDGRVSLIWPKIWRRTDGSGCGIVEGRL